MNDEDGTFYAASCFEAKERARVLDGSSLSCGLWFQQVWQWLTETCLEQWSQEESLRDLPNDRWLFRCVCIVDLPSNCNAHDWTRLSKESGGVLQTTLFRLHNSLFTI